MYVRIIMVSCIVFSSCVGCDNDDPDDGEGVRSSRFAEKYAREKFEDLPEHPDLEKLFADFSAISHAHAFMRDDAAKKLYHDLIVRSFQKETQKDVDDAMFANFILQITPRDILLEAIVPELGPKGKLHGVLETADLSEQLQRQSQQGYPGEPDFRHYAAYLSNHKDEESSPYLIKHMFRTAPSQALHAMIDVQYLGVPYPPLRLSKSARVNAEIRPLLYAEHMISDMIWHQQFRFDFPEEQLGKAKNELSVLSRHKAWWVRLYVAEIMQQHPKLSVPEVAERLQKDENELVRQAMGREDVKKPKPAAPETIKVPVE